MFTVEVATLDPCRKLSPHSYYVHTMFLCILVLCTYRQPVIFKWPWPPHAWLLEAIKAPFTLAFRGRIWISMGFMGAAEGGKPHIKQREADSVSSGLHLNMQQLTVDDQPWTQTVCSQGQSLLSHSCLHKHH